MLNPYVSYSYPILLWQEAIIRPRHCPSRKGGQGECLVMLTGLTNLSEREVFIVVYPDCVDRRWNDGRETTPNKIHDIGFILALIYDLAERFNVDRNVFMRRISQTATRFFQ